MNNLKRNKKIEDLEAGSIPNVEEFLKEYGLLHKEMEEPQSPPTCDKCEFKMHRPSFAGKRYGLLENCNHVVCLVCVRSTNQDIVGKIRHLITEPNKIGVYCPVCEEPSSCVVSSCEFTSDNMKKMKILLDYSVSVKDMPCPYFRKGFGVCFCPPNAHSNFISTFKT